MTLKRARLVASPRRVSQSPHVLRHYDTEGRRCLDPEVAPTAVLALQITDEGQHAEKFKLSHPEEYEEYVVWIKAEEEAVAAAAAAADAEMGRASEGGGGEKRKQLPVVTDPVVKFLVVERAVKKYPIDASGSLFSRLRASKRALSAPHNFTGMIDGDEVRAPSAITKVDETTIVKAYRPGFNGQLVNPIQY